MFVTSRTPVGRELAEALRAAGLEVRAPKGRLAVDGVVIDLPVVERSHPHPGELATLVEAGTGEGDGPGIVVADRISASGRDVLRDAGWSWLDRRGHLRIWQPGLRVETEVALGGSDARGATSSPWTPVGLEVALHALCHPGEPVRARSVAAEIGRSVGGTQEIVGRFTEQGLIGRSGRLPLLPDLFWETSARWPDDDWTPVPAELHEVVDVLGGDALVRVDERAATLGGARIAAAADLPARCYVHGRAALRRARAALGTTGTARTFLRLSPVRWLPELDAYGPDDEHPWHVAAPMVCALRLARDPARGREIVEDWGIVPGEATDDDEGSAP
ncbi:hypothetical protein [Dermatobacter hominis]|uniref:hypothetical protein n=1 Tax=Dermatobacter hominis TaxID=2884263 RepID=UPI001D11B4AA|nr:hypothetical protein [Dermatobacter hominis]UDY35559.1 hypothetical protein LH044_19785 [Dermatobacter hominis]